MPKLRLHRILIALAVALLLGAGPGSPLCNASMARTTEAMAMAGCDQSMPMKKFDPASHPPCTSACIGLDHEAPTLARQIVAPAALVRLLVKPLKGVLPDPEIEPPRSERA